MPHLAAYAVRSGGGLKILIVHRQATDPANVTITTAKGFNNIAGSTVSEAFISKELKGNVAVDIEEEKRRENRWPPKGGLASL